MFLPSIKKSCRYFWLGHPLFNTLKNIFPTLFQGINLGIFHCDDCELAKHKRVTFPNNNKRMSTPFSLVHSDIWGPSNIPNIYGAHWFFIFFMIVLECHGCIS